MTIAHVSLSLLTIIAVLGIIFLVPRLRNFITRHLALLALVTYMLGFTLYIQGFWFGASQNIFTASLRAAISALEMFASRSDLVEVSAHLKEESPLYMFLFSAVHFFAKLLTFIFIVDIFGKRVMSMFEAWSMCWRKHGKKLIIIDGSDENSLALARSIPQNDDCEIAFVKSMIDGETKHFSIANAMLAGLKSNHEKDECESIGRVFVTALPLANAIVQGKGWLPRRLKKLASRYKSTEVFFLAWDSELNADASYMLSKEMENANICIYPGVDTRNPHSAKLALRDNIHPVNRSIMVVNNLIEDTPILKDGADRKTLLIGFGYTGGICVEALVENGFTEIDILGSIVAQKSEEFLCFHPKVREMEKVRFIEYDFNSNGFWSYMYENLAGVDNVIIIGKDDEKIYTEGMRIYEYAKTVKSDMSGFRIYVSEQDAHPGDEVLCAFGKREAIYNYSKF